jgi:hypothetical protein
VNQVLFLIGADLPAYDFWAETDESRLDGGDLRNVARIPRVRMWLWFGLLGIGGEGRSKNMLVLMLEKCLEGLRDGLGMVK